MPIMERIFRSTMSKFLVSGTMMYFPLDLIFMDHQGTIVSLKQMNAYDETNVSSDVPASIVIELNKGTYETLHLKTGMSISIPAEVTASQ